MYTHDFLYMQFPKEQKSSSPTNTRPNPVTHPKVDMPPMPEFAPFSPGSKLRPVVGASSRPNSGLTPGIFGLNQSASGPPGRPDGNWTEEGTMPAGLPRSLDADAATQFSIHSVMGPPRAGSSVRCHSRMAGCRARMW